MNTKATLYLDPKVYRALKVKAAKTDRTVSETANEILGGAMGFMAADAPADSGVRLELYGKFGLPILHGLKFPKDFVFRREDIYE